MVNSTPLSASIVRKDVLSAAKESSSPAIKADEANIANLHITSGKLKDLQADIELEAANLVSLQEAINKSEQISFRLVNFCFCFANCHLLHSIVQTKILNSYESRMASLETIVMPVYRNILNMSQTNDRIEGTISLVEHLMKINEQVRKEVVILLPGYNDTISCCAFLILLCRPTCDNLEVYLDSLNGLESIHKELVASDLGHCRMSIEKAKSAIDDARRKLQNAFKDWLSETHEPEDNSTNEQETHEPNIAVLSPETIAALHRIVEFSLASPELFSSLISDWIETRSNYLAGICEASFSAAQAFEKDSGTYRRGTHPLPLAYDLARRLLEAEEVLMAKVWPGTAAGPTFLRSAQIVRDLAITTVESICSKMKRAVARREYADQVFLFEVIARCHRAVHANTQSGNEGGDTLSSSSESFAVQILLPSLKFFTTNTASLLTDLIGEIRGTIPRALERPFTVPQNATVYELTSITVNVLKRLEADGPVLEALLQGQASDNWDGSLTFIDTEAENAKDDTTTTNDTTNDSTITDNTLQKQKSTTKFTDTKRYFTDLLSSLETSIDAKSKTLRRPMQTLLFQLNNYNYLGKALVGIRNEFIDTGLLKRYDQIIDTLQRSFLTRLKTNKQ